MRLVPAVLATFASGAVAATALAATAPDARRLVLQKGDMQSGSQLAVSSGDPREAVATFVVGPAARRIELSSTAAVAATTAQARVVFRGLRSELGRARAIPLPRYGDEQYAGVRGGARARLIVRKNRVVWTIALRTALGDRKLTSAEATALFKRYGAKQQKRVRAG